MVILKASWMDNFYVLSFLDYRPEGFLVGRQAVRPEGWVAYMQRKKLVDVDRVWAGCFVLPDLPKYTTWDWV